MHDCLVKSRTIENNYANDQSCEQPIKNDCLLKPRTTAWQGWDEWKEEKRIMEINERVFDDLTFFGRIKSVPKRAYKISITACWYLRFLIMANERLQFQGQSDCENLKCCSLPPLLQKPSITLRFIQGIPFRVLPKIPSFHFIPFRAFWPKLATKFMTASFWPLLKLLRPGDNNLFENGNEIAPGPSAPHYLTFFKEVMMKKPSLELRTFEFFIVYSPD